MNFNEVSFSHSHMFRWDHSGAYKFHHPKTVFKKSHKTVSASAESLHWLFASILVSYGFVNFASGITWRSFWDSQVVHLLLMLISTPKYTNCAYGLI